MQVALYECTRCHKNEHQARQEGCQASPCPMAPIRTMTLRAGTVVLVRGVPMRLLDEVLVEAHRDNFAAV